MRAPTVNSTHDGWKDSRVVLYRMGRKTRSELQFTSDVGRRDVVTVTSRT